MRLNAECANSIRSPRGRAALVGAGFVALSLWLLFGAPHAALGASASRAHAAREHFACNDGPKVPCHFSTPSGNVRCLWTPSPNSVACEVVATRRAYMLRPSGRARAIKVNLRRRGETLPTNQQVVFPESLSCHDTRRSMTCNQDFGFGVFTLPLKAHVAH